MSWFSLIVNDAEVVFIHMVTNTDRFESIMLYRTGGMTLMIFHSNDYIVINFVPKA